MLLWFIGVGFVGVVVVFKSPALDYRLVVAGTVLPLVDVVPGVPPVLHTLAASVGALALVMLATRGRRLDRRRWLGLPIGMMVHLVLDGTWSTTELFWWPAFGLDLPDAALPTFGRGIAGVVLEVLGAAAIWWSWRQFRLADGGRRRMLISEGRLDRDRVP
ncbi:MAG: hypothetical protein JJE52_11790 [Acidimicrobiia bacterium]|nr:hypothetical protein [Acidimicrobiia bacterium]